MMRSVGMGLAGIFDELLMGRHIDIFTVNNCQGNVMGCNSLSGTEGVTDFVSSCSVFLFSCDPDSDISREHVVIFSIIVHLESYNFSFVFFTDVEFSVD